MARRWWFAGLALLAVSGLRAQDGEKDKKPAVIKKSDVQLVERLLAARKEYQLTLEALRKHYIQTGDIQRARWAEDELLNYHRINKQAFLLPLAVPPPTLKPTTNVPQANQFYMQALKYKDKGWGTDYVDNQRRAEILLQKLLTEHPQSTKIADAAYQLGDVYESKACKQYRLAAAYFERSFQWDPKTNSDARIRAARLYEKQLNDRVRASQIYKEIITHETNEKHIEEAKARLQEISNRR
jgi:TolA-binding protein